MAGEYDLIIGNCYYVETTGKAYVGRLVAIDGPYCVVLKEASWVADTGRFSTFMRTGHGGSNMEIEPCLPDRAVRVPWSGGSVHDWPHGLFKEVV